MNDDLLKKRIDAAEQSKGISSTDSIYEAFFRLFSDLNLKGSILDYGAGIGNFTQSLYKTGQFDKVTGIDIMARPANLDENIRWASSDLNNPTSFEENTFDVIASPEVIEHLENPRATVREWHRILKPGGTLIYSTPNNESFRSILALIFQGHFVHFGDNSYPAHITALLRKDFERLSLENGLSKPQFYFTNTGGIPKMPEITWQQVSFNMLKGRAFSDNILVLCHKLS